MSILHTVNKSPFTNNVLKTCLEICSESDSILFLEDGVYGTMPNAPLNDLLLAHVNRGTNVFALSNDVQARGLSQKISDFIQLVDYEGLVKLATHHRCIQSWY